MYIGTVLWFSNSHTIVQYQNLMLSLSQHIPLILMIHPLPAWRVCLIRISGFYLLQSVLVQISLNSLHTRSAVQRSFTWSRHKPNQNWKLWWRRSSQAMPVPLSLPATLQASTKCFFAVWGVNINAKYFLSRAAHISITNKLGNNTVFSLSIFGRLLFISILAF